ncbi:hypothetical protein MKX01_019045 [Papaver californicum]|nr:hypothetical protein MKX01_019045 [Papaver californicum]
MVARYTSEEDVAIITSWCNIIFSPIVIQNQLSGLEVWVLVREYFASDFDNPNDRIVDVIKKRVGDIKKEIKNFVMILLPLYRNTPSGWTKRHQHKFYDCYIILKANFPELDPVQIFRSAPGDSGEE